MLTANVHQAKTKLSKLIEAALAGEDVVIARNGVPAVRLVPVGHRADRVPGSWRGKVTVKDPDWWKPDEDLADLFGVLHRATAHDEPPAR